MTNSVNDYAKMIEATKREIAMRREYEMIKKDNDVTANIFNVLRNIEQIMTHEAVAKMLAATNVDVSFINRQERQNARFNVKAIVKVDNIARALSGVQSVNSYTRNVILTCHALTKEDDCMSHYDAQATLCNALKSRSKSIVKYATSIDASTANTQSSSSINALQVFNILRETRNNANKVAYIMNYENENTTKILSVLGVA